MKLFSKNIAVTISAVGLLTQLFVPSQCRAADGEKGEEIQVPNGFEFKPDFKIYRGNGKPLGAVTSFDPETKSDVGAKVTYYVNIATGDNSNDGLTKEAPFKSLWRALKETGSKNVVIEKGRYDYENGSKGVVIVDPVSIKSNGGKAIITTHLPVEFIDLGDGTYKATKSHKDRWGNVVDLTQPIETRVLVKAKSLPVKPGQYYVDKNDLYVSTLDSRKPDQNIITLLAQMRSRLTVLNDCYIENIELWGGYNCIYGKIPEGKRITLNAVTGRYSHGGPGLRFDLAGQGTLYKCGGYNNFSDDFNWHHLDGKNGHVVEIDSIGRYAGQNNPKDSVNSSTAHDKIKIIRINGDYKFAKNRVVADVNFAQSWNIACVSQSSRHSDKKSPWWSQNWSFAHDCKAWIDTCVGTSENNSTHRGWSAEKNAQLYFHNTDYKSGNVRFAKKPIVY